MRLRSETGEGFFVHVLTMPSPEEVTEAYCVAFVQKVYPAGAQFAIFSLRNQSVQIQCCASEPLMDATLTMAS